MEIKDKEDHANYHEIQVELAPKSENCIKNPNGLNESYESSHMGFEHEVIDFNKDFYVLDCPYCKANVTTKMIRKPGKFVWISAILLCLFLPPLCFCPFLIKRCFDKIHICSNCYNKIS